MVGLAAVMALGMSPVLDFTYRLNEWALVPGSSLHEWAGALEAKAAAMTETLLRFGSVGDLMAVLVAVAVLPALCEEWLFRGTVQPVLMRSTGNLHLSVWISAALFSAIHMQFLGLCRACFSARCLATWWPTAAAFGQRLSDTSSTMLVWSSRHGGWASRGSSKGLNLSP